MLSIEEFGELLRAFYLMTRQVPMRVFQNDVLSTVGRYIPFDVAWWSMATYLEDGRHVVHDSFTLGIPPDCDELLNCTESDNLVAQACKESPSACLNFGPEQLYGNLQTAWLSKHMGINQTICATWRDEVPNLISFLSFSRRDVGAPFSEDERHLLKCLMPHLTAMLQVNRIAQLSAIRTGGASSSMALTDDVGMLHAMEPGFDEQMRREWPTWHGPFLPAPLLQSVAAGTEGFRGQHIRVAFSRVGGAIIATVTQLTACDQLTVRERAVAEGFAAGESYKELARRLDLAPSTVRHHLRAIYEKLGVRDKAALARKVSGVVR